jgi:hypothetical protein
LIKAKVNGVVGNFILDTGASNSCVGFGKRRLIQLEAEDSKLKPLEQVQRDANTNGSNNTLQLGFGKIWNSI